MKIIDNNSTNTGLAGRIFNNEEYKFWLNNIYDIYRKMREKTMYGQYETYCIIPINVFPSVYAPDLFTDSYWFSTQLTKLIQKDSSILEIGTGTGIISIILALNGIKKIVATDINQISIKNALSNINRYKLSETISTRVGNVYEPLRGNIKFDYIFWAHPFNNSPIPVSDPLLITGMDYNYNSLRQYIKDARKFLNIGGKLLLGTGDSADIETMYKIAKENNYKMNILYKEKVPIEYGKKLEIEYRIYEFIDYNLV